MDMSVATTVLEMLMMISFGVAWPTSVYKSLRSKTAKGKSIVFSFVIGCGYLFGILSKFYSDRPINYVLIFYFINLAMVATDIVLWFRNRNYDRKAENAV